MKNYLEMLKKCPLFSDINEADLEKMIFCLGAKVVEFDKKYTILREGDEARYVGILLFGSAQIVQMDYYGNRNIIGIVNPGEMFGESFAAAGVKSLPISVIASDRCIVMLIECHRILYTCRGGCDFHRQLIYNLMKSLATKNILFHQRIEITSKRTTREKLMAYLMLMAKRAGKSSFDIPFDRQELADYLEVDRSGLSAEISKMRHEGVLECHKNHFVLL